jgi:3-dehydroquinate synthase
MHTTTTEAVRIDVGSSAGTYAVHIASGHLGSLGAQLRDIGVGAQQFVVSSPTVWRFHGTAIAQALPEARTILIPDGERFKHLQTVNRIYEALGAAAAEREAAVVAVGGGVVGDVAGFAAATWMRGIPLVQVPTTLVAQVDSAIGGKVGVNHPAGKNLIGAFHAPRLVAIDPTLLATLPRREFRAGLYEVVKYGIIASGALFDRVAGDLDSLFKRKPESLVPTIVECCRIKARIVTADEREAGERRLLNLGHTVGHALEAVTKYRRFRHGEAVAYGLLAAGRIAAHRGLLPEHERQRIADLIVALGPLPPIADLAIGEVLEALRHDKKVSRGALRFVLPVSIGSALVVDNVQRDEIARTLTELGMRG